MTWLFAISLTAFNVALAFYMVPGVARWAARRQEVRARSHAPTLAEEKDRALALIAALRTFVETTNASRMETGFEVGGVTYEAVIAWRPKQAAKPAQTTTTSGSPPPASRLN